jgi:hypothetical protein
MNVEHVDVLVEEPSMEAALRLLLPRLLGQVSFEVYPFQCKDELLARLPARLRGYRPWLPESWRVVVIVDRDNDDCQQLKNRLEHMARGAGLTTKSSARCQQYRVVNRLAIEELEAWYFGDWEAVRAVYPRVSENIPRKSAYFDPDAIGGGTWEAFERVLGKAGYFKGGLRKIEAARTIVPHMDPDRNSSRSFQAFRDVLREMVQA